MTETLLTEQQVADRLGVKVCTVANERKRGKLGFTPVGAKIRVSDQQLNEYLQRQKVEACVSGNQNPDRSATIGLPKSRVATGSTMRGATHGMMVALDKHVVSALAQRTFKRRA